MGGQESQNTKKHISAGLLAHVDAGKTTLSEAMLYLAGSIRKLGRVDHKDAFLDTQALERERGITIFSKQAVLGWKEAEITLLDTPGHVDFSAEMERTLQVLDAAVLVINGTDGVQGHTETLWHLLERYRIPVYLFVNKMDLPGVDPEGVLEQVKHLLSENCVSFDPGQKREQFLENLAVCHETLLDEYMQQGTISPREIERAIQRREVFPVYFGSALRLQGVEDLLDGLTAYTGMPDYPPEFRARVYKILRDEQGNRLTCMKITGGSLAVKEILTYTGNNGEQVSEKADQLRIYNGQKYTAVDRVTAGTICAVTGLTQTHPGQGMGAEGVLELPLLAPVMTYRMLLPKEQDASQMLRWLKELEEEDPQLHIRWNETVKEIHVQLMGEVQIEILREVIRERFHVEVEFGTGSILYRETIAAPVEGMGHYEPLRHYAEVHLLMEPGEPGTGLVFAAECSEDELDRNWQRLVLTHLEEREHCGVLTGAPITDMKITLVAGRAHIKHTEGGDFRQATYRAVRHGLMHAKNVLLEPMYSFTMELPTEVLGRAMSDVERMSGSFLPPEPGKDRTILMGTVPVAQMQGYAAELTAYTKGRGRLTLQPKGYAPCHNAAEVIEAIGYDAQADLDNSADSVFCSHGAGFLVSWQESASYMHVESGIKKERLAAVPIRETAQGAAMGTNQSDVPVSPTGSGRETGRRSGGNEGLGSGYRMDKELEEIFTKTFGAVKRKMPAGAQGLGYESRKKETVHVELPEIKHLPEYLLVDGYNVIFAWEELAALARENLEAARWKLMDLLCNYQGYQQCRLILVFDAYRVKGNPGEVSKYHNIDVVYTKEAETADMYIEKVTHEIARKYRVTVATSDALEQLIVIGQGAVRLSAREFQEEVERVTKEGLETYLARQPQGRNFGLRDVIKTLEDQKKDGEQK